MRRTLLAALILLSILPPAHVRADSFTVGFEGDDDLEHTLIETPDFEETGRVSGVPTLEESAARNGTYGVLSASHTAPGFTSGRHVSVEIEVDSAVTQVTWWLRNGTIADGSGSISNVAWLLDAEGGIVDSAFQNLAAGTTNTWRQVTINLSGVEADVVVITSRYLTNGAPVGSLHVDDIVITTTDEVFDFVKPLTPGDLNSWGMMRNAVAGVQDQSETVLSYSVGNDAYVYAGASGTVDVVRQATYGDCVELLTGAAGLFLQPPPPFFAGSVCQVMVESSVSGDANDRFFTIPDSITAAKIDGQRVTIIDDDSGLELHYLVRSANDYVAEGQSVQAGCYIGRTLTLITQQIIPTVGGIVTVVDNESDIGLSAVTVVDDGEIIDSIEHFTVDPFQQNACNVPEDYEQCFGDGALQIRGDWQTSGSVIWNDPGVTLSPGAGISSSRPYNLAQNQAPRLRVSARALGGSGRINVRLGETNQTFNLANSYQDYEIAGAEHAPDIGSLYTISIDNSSTSAVQVQYACLSHSLDAEENPVNEPPPQCYFVNNSFNDGTLGWTVSSNVDSAAGEIRVPDEETWSQNVTIHPTAPSTSTDYRIRVRAALWFYPSYTLDPEDSNDVAVEYEFPSGGYTAIDTLTYGTFAANDNLVVFENTFSISDDTGGAFTFRANLSDVPSGVRGLAIRDVCLEPADGGPFPGDYGTGTPTNPHFDASCLTISPPSGNEIGPWLTWHWDKFNNFFQCELMIVLNAILRLFTDTYELAMWYAQFFQYAVNNGVSWMATQVLPYLAGHIVNSSGTVTIFTTATCAPGDMGCYLFNIASQFIDQILGPLVALPGDLLDVIETALPLIADILSQIITELFGPLIGLVIYVVEVILGLLGEIVRAIIAIIFFIVVKIFELFEIVRDILAAIITAYNNAPPLAIPGLPDCSLEIHGLCAGFWILENTVFTGNGEYFIPLMISIGSILMLIWAFQEIKRALIRLGELT